MSKLKKLSKARYEALTYAVHPIVNDICQILERYSDINEKLIGVLLIDRADMDWGYVILGRDESYIFRWIAGQHSLKSIVLARQALRKALFEQLLHPELVYIQENGIIDKKDIFAPPNS